MADKRKTPKLNWTPSLHWIIMDKFIWNPEMSNVNSSAITTVVPAPPTQCYNDNFLSSLNLTQQSVTLDSSNFFCNDDMLHRTVVDSTTKSLTIASWPTIEAMSYFRQKQLSYDEDIEILKKITEWQHRNIEYQATYSAYLLGAIDEAEFEIDSQEYVSEIKEIPPEQIAPTIEKIVSLLSFQLSPSELAEYFEVDLNTINQALSQLPSIELNEYKSVAE